MVSLEDLISKPRKQAGSYGELLPWFGMVDEGTVLCHDGGLLAGFAYEGSDIEGVPDEDVSRRIDLLQTAMRQLTDRITVWSIQRRRFVSDYPFSTYLNPVAQLIEDEWARKCTEYPNAKLEHRLYVGYSFPNQTEAFVEQLRAEMEQSDNALAALFRVLGRKFREKSAVASVRGQLGEMKEDFENILSSFSNIVTTSLGFRRIYGPDLLGDLYAQANLASPAGPISVPARPVYLNTLLPADDLIRQNSMLELRGPSSSVYCAALSTTGMPPEAFSGHLDQLMAAPCEYVMVQTFKIIDRYLAEKAIQSAEQFYRSEIKSPAVRIFEGITGIESQKVNTGNLALADDAQQALVGLTAGDIAYGFYNMTVLALGATPKEVDRACDIIASTLRAGGYAVTRERQGLMPAFLGSLAGNQKVQLRKYLASTANLSDLSPIRTISPGDAEHKLFAKVLQRSVPAHIRFLTPYGIPYDFSCHAEDLGHTVVVGGSGSGKSVVMSLLTALFQKYHPCNTFIFDKDYSLSLMSTLLGGATIDMAKPQQAGVKLNPVRRMLEDGEDKALLRWLDVLMSASGFSLTPEEKETVNAALQRLKSVNKERWRLGTLYSFLAGSDKNIAMRLGPYVDRSDTEGSYAKGPFAEYFDNDEDSFTLGSIVCMETGKLLESEEIAAPFMDYCFYCVERRLDGRTPTMIFVEEAWYMLRNPAFQQKIDDWLRTFRKKRAFVMFATQSPDELGKLEAWPAFASNVPTRIFLPAINDSVSTTGHIYRELFGMNDAQLSALANAVPKRDYLLLKPGLTRLVTAEMPRLVIAINEATTRRDLRELAQEAARSGNPDWQMNYIQEVLNVPIQA